ncbi:TPA: hypothetical protein DDW35_00120 [Candidatus Sumerlaeota bacterium]|nr:hypothetical protein [Candidatus Sumerlaeota bacterium]
MKTQKVKFSTALYDFDAFLDTEKNLSPKTRRAYSYDLERFADHWIKRRGANPSLHQISSEDIQRYLEHLRMNLNYKSTTLSRTISSIRVFFEFCVMRGFLENSPAVHVHNPKSPKKLPIFLVDSELKNLLNTSAETVVAPEVTLADDSDDLKDVAEITAGRPIPKHHALRDYAILALFSFTGVRLSELIGLDLPDLDFERKTIRVMGKGSKERMIPLNETVIQALQAWLSMRPQTPGEESVFLNRSNKRFSARGVEFLVERYVKRAGITKRKISPHKLRHTFATLLHVNGVDILEIQALLGHSSILSTQIYTHVSASRLKDAVKKLDGF